MIDIDKNVAIAGPINPTVKYPTAFSITFKIKLIIDVTKINCVLPIAFRIMPKYVTLNNKTRV